jgi:hypothetical protein
MRYCFDIDGVIALTEGTGYHDSRPNERVISRINELYAEGHEIVLHTARGMGTLDGDLWAVHQTWYEFTIHQMRSWGLHFHQLFLGKPYADVYVDDKGLNVDDWSPTDGEGLMAAAALTHIGAA